MSIYWVLLTVTAFFAYLIGSMDTMVLASNFVFHRNLRRLGGEETWISNFYRIYGVPGFLKLLAVELGKDILPLVIGSLLLGIRGHGDAGAAFAGFVMVLGRLWPVFYGFRGGSATFALSVAGFAAGRSVGFAVLVVALIVTVATRYVSLGAVAGAVVCVMISVLAVDDALLLRLALLTAGIVVLRHIPAVIRVFRHTEPRLSFERDITYKLDE